MSLLPPNASGLEKALEKAIDYRVDPSIISGFKFKTSDPDNQNKLALSWEYSLSKIHVENFADRIKQGFEFHRYRGTPYALKMAFSWYNFNDVTIEEEPPGTHFAEFQIGLNEIPNNLEVDTIIDVAKTAAPVRSRLSRMYNSLYDVRRFILDNSKFGDILSDNSGIKVKEDSPKLSFGRKNHYCVQVDKISEKHSNRRDYCNFAKNIDVFRLDFGQLDDAPIDAINHKGVSFPERYIWNTDSIGQRLENLLQANTKSKALIILSESMFGDINACFSGGYEKLTEEPFVLSFSKLSQHKATVQLQPIDERFYREKLWSAISPFTYSTSTCRRDREYGAVCNDMPCVIHSINERKIYCTAEYLGNNTWHDNRHFSVPWIQQSSYCRITNDLWNQ